MPIKNLVIFTERFPYYGGEQFLELEIEYLADKFEKIIIVPRTDSSEIRKLPENVQVSRLTGCINFYDVVSTLVNKYVIREIISNWKLIVSPKGLYRLLNFAIYGNRVRHWIKKMPSEVQNLTCFYSYWMAHAAVGISWAKYTRTDIKFISRAHRWDLYSYVHTPQYLPFRSDIFKSANLIFPVSQGGAIYLEQNTGASPQQITVSRLGVDKAKRLSDASSDGAFRIVSCSYFVPVKRVEIIIQIISQLARHQEFSKKIYWTHFGDGPLQDNLISLANARFTDQIEWRFAGNVKNSEILNFYAENPVDIFINTSSSEGIPVSIMEAQAHGIPVFATNVGGVSEIVNHSNGLLLDVNFEIEEVVKNLMKVSTDSLLMSQLRCASFLMWFNKYNATKNYEDFYNEIISSEDT